MTTRTCRRCGVELTVTNARRSRGRWVGACRRCEATEGNERARRARQEAAAHRAGTRVASDIAHGTREALLQVLDAAGGYPMTRDDILTAIRAGVADAVTQHLEHHGLPA